MTSARRKRILIAEDDPDVAELLSRMLSTLYDVSRADDGPAALALASRETPDLVLADVMMPGFDGFGLVQRLKMVPETKHVPVIFITARSQPEDVVHGVNLGAKAYITKPFKVKDVLAKIRSVIGE